VAGTSPRAAPEGGGPILGIGGGRAHHRMSSMAVRGVQGGVPVKDCSVDQGGRRCDRGGGRSLGGTHGGDGCPEEGETSTVHGELHMGMNWPGG
jgi:hypothetical protein